MALVDILMVCLSYSIWIFLRLLLLNFIRLSFGHSNNRIRSGWAGREDELHLNKEIIYIMS